MTYFRALLNKGDPDIDILIIKGGQSRDDQLLVISLSTMTPDML